MHAQTILAPSALLEAFHILNLQPTGWPLTAAGPTSGGLPVFCLPPWGSVKSGVHFLGSTYEWNPPSQGLCFGVSSTGMRDAEAWCVVLPVSEGRKELLRLMVKLKGLLVGVVDTGCMYHSSTAR